MYNSVDFISTDPDIELSLNDMIWYGSLDIIFQGKSRHEAGEVNKIMLKEGT